MVHGFLVYYSEVCSWELCNLILKIMHFIEAIIYYLIGNLLILIHRYDRNICSTKYFSGFFSEGWSWIFHDWHGCLINGSNSNVPWPVSSQNKVAGWQNIDFYPEDLHNFQGKGCYFQAVGKISIGKGTYIANNVGIITANHDINDPSKHVKAEPVKIGEACWIGMNSIILPGVELGPHTTVGAGSVVTRSYPDGYCVIAGNPAHLIKKIPKE